MTFTRIKTLTIAVISILLMPACSQTRDKFSPGNIFEQSSPARAENARFDFTLYRQLAAGKKDNNLIVSPYSVSNVLKMVLVGADGKTKEEILKALGVDSNSLQTLNESSKSIIDSLRKPGADTKLKIGNSIFANKDVHFKADFLSTNKKYYDAEVASVDFASPSAAAKINDWASKATNGKIPAIINQTNKNDALYLLNAIYFKGSWRVPFLKYETRDEDFNISRGQTKKVRMMHQDTKFSYMENDNLQMVELPYADDRLSLTVVLPAKKSSLDAFEVTLNDENWKLWKSQLSRRPGNLGLPRFKFEVALPLIEPLERLGIEKAFSPEEAAFGKMAEVSKNIFISMAMQKALIEVNEEGTEAVAITSLRAKAARVATKTPPPFEMIVDRPFFFALQDAQTNSILFMGHVTEP